MLTPSRCVTSLGNGEVAIPAACTVRATCISPAGNTVKSQDFVFARNGTCPLPQTCISFLFYAFHLSMLLILLISSLPPLAPPTIHFFIHYFPLLHHPLSSQIPTLISPSTNLKYRRSHSEHGRSHTHRVQRLPVGDIPDDGQRRFVTGGYGDGARYDQLHGLQYQATVAIR